MAGSNKPTTAEKNHRQMKQRDSSTRGTSFGFNNNTAKDEEVVVEFHKNDGNAANLDVFGNRKVLTKLTTSKLICRKNRRSIKSHNDLPKDLGFDHFEVV